MGGIERAVAGEDRIHIPSPKVATYDLKPEMSAYIITDQVVQKIKNMTYDLYILNFANADMVAHTGSFEATVKAVEVLDQCVGRIVSEAFPKGGAVVITSDHGNADQMLNPLTGGVNTEHSANPVPFLVISEKFRGKPRQLQSGILADVAPTVVSILGLAIPQEMTGRNLLMY